MPITAGLNSKRVIPNAANSGTLAEMMARRKALAEQMNAGQPKEIGSWTQGAAGALSQIMNGFQQRSLREEETAGRQRLAEIQSGVNLDTGATSQQIAEVGMYDPDLAKTLMEGAVRARQDAAARSAAVEDRDFNRDANVALQDDRQDFEKAANDARMQAEKDAADAKVTADKAAYTQQNSDKILAEEARVKAEASQRLAEQHEANSAYNAKVKAEQDAAKLVADAKAAEPQGAVEEILHAAKRFASGESGLDPKDPKNQALFEAAMSSKLSKDKGMRISFAADGTPIIEMGGSDGGSVAGSNPDVKNTADALAEYETDRKSANTLAPSIDAAGKSVDAAGAGGPFAPFANFADDVLTSYGPEGAGNLISGSPEAREMVTQGGLQQIFDKIKQTKGAVTENEMAIFANASLSLSKVPGANKILVDMAKAIIQRSNERADAAQAYFKQYGDLRSGPEPFEAQWRTKIAAEPILAYDDNGMPTILGKKTGDQPNPADPAAPANPASPASPAASGASESPVSEWSDEEVNAGQIDPAKEARRQAAKGAQRGQP